MKRVAVARKSLLTIAFCIIFRGASHGDRHFAQNHDFWWFFEFCNVYFLAENVTINRISKNDAECRG